MGIGPSYKMVVDQSTGKHPDNDRCADTNTADIPIHSQQNIPVHFGTTRVAILPLNEGFLFSIVGKGKLGGRG